MPSPPPPFYKLTEPSVCITECHIDKLVDDSTLDNDDSMCDTGDMQRLREGGGSEKRKEKEGTNKVGGGNNSCDGIIEDDGSPLELA